MTEARTVSCEDAAAVLRWAAACLQAIRDRAEHGCEDEGLRRAIDHLSVQAHEAECLAGHLPRGIPFDARGVTEGRQQEAFRQAMEQLITGEPAPTRPQDYVGYNLPERHRVRT